MIKFWFFLVSITGITGIDLKTCNDMHDYINTSKELNLIHDITCDQFTTFTVSGYDLTIQTSKSTTLRNIRFEVIDGASLTFGDSIVFRNAIEVTNENNAQAFPDVRGGGAFYVGENSKVKIRGHFETYQIGIGSEYNTDGGCIWNNGNFHVFGSSTMRQCDNKSGESNGGKGGAIFNGVNGIMKFDKGMSMSETSSTNDGSLGAGFYNLGSVIIKGTSKFSEMHSSVGGGAIYNGEGAVFKFRSDSVVLFNRCADEGVINDGVLGLYGITIFLEDRTEVNGAQIYVGPTGTMKMKRNSIFFRRYQVDEIYDPIIVVADGGDLNYSKTTKFVTVALPDGVCGGIYFEKDQSCKS